MNKIDDHLLSAVQSLQAHRDILHGQFHIDSLSIFGSISKGTARPDSGLDIIVHYKKVPGLFEFHNLKQ